MRPHPRLPQVTLLLVLWLLSAGMVRADGAPVRVAVAANFRTVLEGLVADYRALDARARIDVISGSTGKLYAQVLAGAPYDVFLAADRDRPQRLEAAERIVPGTRHTYAIGRLVLWDPGSDSLDGPERLRDGEFRRLALANPALAPYGAAAQAVLRDLGLDDALDGRLVFGENVAQAFAYVRSGNAGLGFIALSQLRALPDPAIGSYWEPPLAPALAIRQDMVLLGRAEGREEVWAFYRYLLSESASKAIEDAGYRLPPSR